MKRVAVHQFMQDTGLAWDALFAAAGGVAAQARALYDIPPAPGPDDHQEQNQGGDDPAAVQVPEAVGLGNVQPQEQLEGQQEQNQDDGINPAAEQVPEAAGLGDDEPHEQAAGQQEQNQDGVALGAEQGGGAGCGPMEGIIATLLGFCFAKRDNIPDLEQQVPVPRNIPNHVSITFTAIGLEEIGINLNVSDRNRFTDMAIRKRSFGPHLFKDPLLLGRELVLPQLFLGNVSSNYLVNMAAWEVCTAESYVERDTIVCSYIRILAMLMHREDDVHQLRAAHLMEGELTDRETLDLITSLGKHLPMGERCALILTSIEEYKLGRWLWIAVHKFLYLYFKKIATFFCCHW